ncbi:MAG: hypothetical protein OEW83_19015 [Acidimicrobiia bacterium]|nr:hypothetical protein [Acidimicrobiia bacterium]
MTVLGQEQVMAKRSKRVLTVWAAAVVAAWRDEFMVPVWCWSRRWRALWS